ncbi:AAA ATPase superfamily [Stigmatella aurantiaca DW4/3-1]|uniref:AAA ATPase superfamily n=2 Tax=Stigmatella aurantiaca TaxID=41 RepID=Q08VC5_STIAD|nr:AAA ATPase superfamily [Stigmatella aurantiaca DW4/3-1]EAU64447.1 AAA ATPase superfamily [Stigmatella aurantiaca DW4/3-1]
MASAGTPSTAPWLEELDILIRARYPMLYLVSWEEHRVESLLAELARSHGKALFHWSIIRGLRNVGSARAASLPEDTRNPIDAIAAIEKLTEPSLVVLKDFHPYLEDKGVVRAVRELAHFLKHGAAPGIRPRGPLRPPLEAWPAGRADLKTWGLESSLSSPVLSPERDNLEFSPCRSGCWQRWLSLFPSWRTRTVLITGVSGSKTAGRPSRTARSNAMTGGT